jgi:hypothetical protein
MDVSPFQQSIATGDPGSAQDALHEALAAVRNGSREFVIAAGTLYKIGEEPEKKTRTVGHLWWKRDEEYTPIQMFGRGFGGRRWLITWPDGTAQSSSNLWHWEDNLDMPDNATLQQAPFWGNNLRMNGVENLLAPVPRHMRSVYEIAFPGGFFCILDSREDFMVRMAREREQWKNRTLLKKIWLADMRPMKRGGGDAAESRIGQFVRIKCHQAKRRMKRMVNKVICTNCYHPRQDHWEMGDDFTGPIDWGCNHTKNGKRCKC